MRFNLADANYLIVKELCFNIISFLQMLAEYRLDSLMDGDDDDDSEGRTTMQLQTSTGRSASTFALDWLSDNVYWTDWDKIEMSRRNGSSRRIIVWQNCRPRTITVDPLARFALSDAKI